MNNKMELRLAGSGGQGVILATVILAEAAVIAGKYTAQSQSYGPEARGGSCKAEVIISDEPIAFTKVTHPTFLLALTQASLNQYSKNLPEDCKIMMDSSLTPPEFCNPEQLIPVPILETAREKVGKAFTANIVAVGAINQVLKLVDQSHLKEAVLLHIPKGTERLNSMALKAGIALISGDEK